MNAPLPETTHSAAAVPAPRRLLGSAVGLALLAVLV
jgi:hypothetical protein